MILGNHDSTGATAEEAGANGIVALTAEMPHEDALVPKLSALLDADGAGSGSQSIRAGIWETDGTLVAVSEPVEIAGTEELGWYDFTFEEPVEWAKGVERVLGLHFGIPDAVARWYGLGEGLAVADTFSDGTDDYVPAETEPGPAPLLFATYVTPPSIPGMVDLENARLGFYSAQERLSTPGSVVERHRAVCGWHGTWLDPEPQGGSFAIVDRESDLQGLVGERIKVTIAGRSVVAYVHRSTELDSGDIELSLSRRAFAALAVLSTEELRVKVEVLA